jgi:HK97 family phage portal protein
VSIVGSLLHARADPIDSSIDPYRIPQAGESYQSWAGLPIWERRALQETAVHACVSLISDSITQMPIDTFRGTGANRQTIATPRVLQEPWPNIGYREFVGQMAVSLLLRGNCFARVVGFDNLGYPQQLMPLHPDEVFPRIDNGNVVYRVLGEKGLLTPLDVWHVKGITLPGRWEGLLGLSPLEFARQQIGTSLAATEFGARWFQQGAVPSGLLTTPNNIDENTAQAMQDRWVKSHGMRDRRPAVLGGGLTYQPISLRPDESQFLETIKASRSQIAGFYHVPPWMIGETGNTSRWGSGIEEELLGLITFAVMPIAIRLEDAMSRILPSAWYVKCREKALIRGRIIQRYQAYTLARQGGWLNVDEIRADDGMEPLADGKGQDYLQPLNYVAIPPGGFSDLPPDQQPPAYGGPSPTTDEPA